MLIPPFFGFAQFLCVSCSCLLKGHRILILGLHPYLWTFLHIIPAYSSRLQEFIEHFYKNFSEYDASFLTGADIRSVCTEAGMYAIRARRKTVTEKDFLDAVNKVIKGYQKFSATPKYMVYNWGWSFPLFLPEKENMGWCTKYYIIHLSSVQLIELQGLFSSPSCCRTPCSFVCIIVIFGITFCFYLGTTLLDISSIY